MKKLHLILIGVAIVAIIVLLVIFYNPMTAAYNRSSMKDLDIRQGQSFEQVVNPGISGFVSMRNSAIPYLVEILDKDDNGSVRTGAVIAISKIGYTPEGTAALLRSLEKASMPELPAVIWALSGLKEKASADVVKLLKTGKSEHTRAAAAKILGKIGDKASAPALTDALSDTNSYVTVAAAAALLNMNYAPATSRLISLAKRLAEENNAGGVDTVCSTLISCTSDSYSDSVFDELGSNEIPALLKACREYCKKLSEGTLLPKLKQAIVSDNKIERESAIIIAAVLSIGSKEQIALAALDDEDPITLVSALEMLREVGTPACLDRVVEMVDHDDKEVGSAALVSMGKIVDRNRIGDPPMVTTNPKDNPREAYILVALEHLKDANLRIGAAKSLEYMSRINAGTSYEDWNAWWTDFKNTSRLVKELVTVISSINLEHKTDEAFAKAGPLITRAEQILDELEQIASRNTKITKWVEEQRSKVSNLRYVYNKSKPLDIMK